MLVEGELYAIIEFHIYLAMITLYLGGLGSRVVGIDNLTNGLWHDACR